ncbi:MAG: lysylphosphatidylglycerol synthase domain-containing protein, partial [Planctomycetota bacterium]
TRLLRGVVRLRVFRRFFSRLAVRARRMEDQVSGVFRDEGWAALLAFLSFLGIHIVLFLRPALFFLFGSTLRLGMGPLSLIFVASQVLLCFQLTPSGVGTLDGGLIGTFALIGLPEAQCMAYLLALRFWDVLVMGGGGFLAARVGTQLAVPHPSPGSGMLKAGAEAGDPP